MKLTPRTIQRWREQDERGFDLRFEPETTPRNKLSQAERKKVVETVHQHEHRDRSPKQIVPSLADPGIYIGSESTIYRILHEEDALQQRGPTRPRSARRPREHVATGPCELWSWDHTALWKVSRKLIAELIEREARKPR